MILVIGFLLLVSLVISSLIAGFSTYFSTIAPGLDSLIQAAQLCGWFCGVTTLLFALIFQIRARRSHYLGRCLVRFAIVTALLFSIGKFFNRAVSRVTAGFASSYGAAAVCDCAAECGFFTPPKFCFLAQNLPRFSPSDLAHKFVRTSML